MTFMEANIKNKKFKKKKNKNLVLQAKTARRKVRRGTL
jgi:hypothetical protein